MWTLKVKSRVKTQESNQNSDVLLRDTKAKRFPYFYSQCSMKCTFFSPFCLDYIFILLHDMGKMFPHSVSLVNAGVPNSILTTVK